MKLPYRKNVYIPKAKITAYLLSPTHAVGRFKAQYFYTFGYDKSNVHLFEESLRIIAQSQDVKELLPTLYGTKYVIDGKMDTPNRQVVTIRTIWIIEKGQKRPHFVTAYPV